MKEIFIAVILLADLGFRFTPFAKRNPRSSFQGATITGQLVDAGTRQPLRGAIVSATRAPTDKPNASPNIGFRTGEDGKFVLRGVAPGIVNFYVTKAGYAPGPYASVRPAANGEQIQNVVLAVRPAASLGGRVVDESGQPAVGAIVTIPSNSPGRAGLARSATDSIVVSAGQAAMSVRTDDDGRYWIGGLDAGDHSITVRPYGDALGISTSIEDVFVAASVRGKPVGIPVPAGGPQFVTVTLDAGENVADADLMVRFPRLDSRLDQRQSNPGVGVISGRVIDAAGRAVAHAIVVMTPNGEGGLMSVSTDVDGAFQFINVPVGSFTLGARTASSFNAALDPRGPTLASVSVAAGSRIENVVLTVRRGAVISGTITDEFGEPVWASVMAAGPYGTDQGVMGRVGNTDARGRYRIAGLPPGDYLVSAQPFAGGEIHFGDYGGRDRVLTSAPVYYPGVNRASLASKLTVADEAESGNIDFVFQAMPVASINVTIIAGRPVNDVQLHHIALDERLSVQNTIRVTGSAATLDVAPGHYRLVASTEIEPGSDKVTRLWSVIEVDADSLLPSNVNMTLEPGARMSGRLMFEGITSATRQGAGPALAAIQALPGTILGIAAGDPTFDVDTGRFGIEGIMPGRYVIQAGRAERNRSPWMLKAATIGGRDVLDEPIDLRPGDEITDVRLTLTDRIDELSGSVADATDKPSRDNWVVVFSVDNRYWWPGSRRTRAVRPDANGHYVIRALPAGSYFVALVPDPTSPEELLSKLPALATSGVRITIAEGERRTQDLRKK